MSNRLEHARRAPGCPDTAAAGDATTAVSPVMVVRTERGWSVVAPEGSADVGDLLEGLSLADLLAGYRFRDSAARPPRQLATVTVVTAAADRVAAAVAAGEVTAGSVAWARDLVNTPPNLLDPAGLAARACARLDGLPPERAAGIREDAELADLVARARKAHAGV